MSQDLGGSEKVVEYLADKPEKMPDPQEDWERYCRVSYEYDQVAEKAKALQPAIRPFYQKIIQEILSADNDGNSVCSPINIYIALTMLVEMTSGNTQKQILDFLGAGDLSELSIAADLIWKANNRDELHGICMLSNSVWMKAEESENFNEQTLLTLRDRYHADSFVGKMGTGAFDQRLQKWVNESTGGKLENEVKGLRFSPMTLLALCSAIYFKAEWEKGFFETETRKTIFYGQNGESECDMMHRSCRMNYYRGEHFGAVGLDMKYPATMYFVLPDEGTAADDVLADKALYQLFSDGCNYQSRREAKVELFIPKFNVHQQTDLSGVLERTGITDAFDLKHADYSRIKSQGDPLVLNKADHTAMIEIDEDGVSGAAYTAVYMLGCLPPSPVEKIVFRADRPFIYAVTGPDGSILFAGMVRDLP